MTEDGPSGVPADPTVEAGPAGPAAADQPAPIGHPHRGRPGLGLTLIMALVVVVADQLTKWWAERVLAGRVTPIHLFWTLQLNLTHNSGMAFSRGRGFGPIIAPLALVVVAGILLTVRTGTSRAAALAVGAVVGGAIGNVTDRLFRAGSGGFLHGSVIDFIDAQWWPVFNVADIGVVVGGCTLALVAVLNREPR
jgi:signal peptidase II